MGKRRGMGEEEEKDEHKERIPVDFNLFFFLV